MTAPLSRQIDYVVDRHDCRDQLRLSSLLSDIGQHSSTSSSEVHRLSLRINALLHPNRDVGKGLQLALEVVQQLSWDSVVPYASQWISSALTHFSLAIKDAVALLNKLLDQDAKERSEYWRNVASINVPKYALALLETIDLAQPVDSETMAIVLEAITMQTRLHPNVYRSHAAQLQRVCTRLLKRQDLTVEVSKLLAALHSTGKGQANQVQLWSTTLDLLIEDARVAWMACSSTFEQAMQEDGKVGFMAELPSDALDALSEAHLRLGLLLGKPPAAGIIAIFLSEPTTEAVPVPLQKLVSLALSILSISATSLPCQRPPPEANLHAAQTSLLSAAHISALVLLASLPLPIYYANTNRIVSRVLKVIERSSASVRCVAFKALLVMDPKLDPSHQISIHCSRTCMAQICRLIKASASASTPATALDKMDQSTKKASKRRKIYESDQVQFARKRGFIALEEDEYAGCVAAVTYVSYLYEGLATHLTPEHYDLAHTVALVLLGVAEISLQQPDDLTSASLRALAQLVRLSRGSILALLTTRAASLASQALPCAHFDTRSAARSLSHALEFTFHPRLPPKLSLRAHVEEDKWQADEQEVVLGKVELEEDRGTKEIQAMQDILDIPDDEAIRMQRGEEELVQQQHTTTSSSSMLSPRLDSPRRKGVTPIHLSPDPVKPSRRPSTPRIGSPSTTSAAHAALARTRSSSSSSSSPERPASAQLFASSTSSLTATANAPLMAPVVQTTTTTTTTAAPLTNASSPLARHDMTLSDVDSDEDAIPELDLRSSDEESQEEEEEGEDVDM